MRIAIMLRSFEEKGGIGVYTRNIVPELLNIDRKNRYYLLYNNPNSIGHFAEFENVKELFVRGKNKAIWDQISVPLVCRRKKIDVVFHPKFTVPIFSPCKSVMVVHGADWFMPDQAIYYSRLDVAYMRTMMPLYFRKAKAVISVSRLTTDNFHSVLKIPPDKIRTIYFGPAKIFKPIHDKDALLRVKSKYQLPDKFILTLTKRKGDKRKNLGQIFLAYQQYHRNAINPHQLVIGGKDCYLYRQEYQVPEDDYGKDIMFPGWIDQADLPAVYSLADLLLYPSNLEAFPIPITEAMACGTPIITSNANGLKEIAGDAALFVSPNDHQEIANAIQQILSDMALSTSLSNYGLERSKLFSWDTCAQKTLELLEYVTG